MTQVGVHQTHCCKLHGCKYGSNAKCPVVACIVDQEFPCESCETPSEQMKGIRYRLNELSSYLRLGCVAGEKEHRISDKLRAALKEADAQLAKAEIELPE